MPIASMEPRSIAEMTSCTPSKNRSIAYKQSHCKQTTSANDVCGKTAGIVRDPLGSAGIVREGKSLLGRVGSLPAAFRFPLGLSMGPNTQEKMTTLLRRRRPCSCLTRADEACVANSQAAGAAESSFNLVSVCVANTRSRIRCLTRTDVNAIRGRGERQNTIPAGRGRLSP